MPARPVPGSSGDGAESIVAAAAASQAGSAVAHIPANDIRQQRPPMHQGKGKMDPPIQGQGMGDFQGPMSPDIKPRMNEELIDGRSLGMAIVQKATLWVRMLPTCLSEWEILQLFNSVASAYPDNACNVVGCNFAYRDSQDGLQLRVGTATAHFLYPTLELAEYAQRKLNGLFVEGRHLDVRISTKPLDFRWSAGGPIRGQTRTGDSLWKCPDGSLDPRLSWRG